MKLYRILHAQAEGRSESNKRSSNVTIEARVDPGAHASVISQFAQNGRAITDDQTETPEKKQTEVVGRGIAGEESPRGLVNLRFAHEGDW